MKNYATILIVMAERLPRVVVDEVLSERSQKSYLKVELIVDDAVETVISLSRSATPQFISRILNETGCFIKYDESMELPEEERQRIGDMFIEASYNVPGLG